jgi:ABC-2 type transport system ATP-binding protein
MTEPAIVVSDLLKTYGPIRAVDGVSLTVERGELLGLLGPNGAGKTTMVEILEGYRRADRGTVRVLGLDPWRDGARLKPRMGLMLQEGGVYPSASPLEVLRLFAAFYADPLAPEVVLRTVGLEAAARTRFRRLSGGQKQRLSLGLALIGRPEVVFLDEPTAAMDPQARRATWDLILDLKRRGVTILLTTHFMDEAERLCDRVAIVDRGQIIALESPSRLIDARAGARGWRFRGRAGLDTSALSLALGGTEVREVDGGRYVVSGSATPALIAELASWMRDRGMLVEELQVGSRTLEDVFIQLTGRELRE